MRKQINIHAVASLRPQPFGLPLRGRAPRNDGMNMGRSLGRSEPKTRDRRFHLKFAGSWFKIGGKRIVQVAMNASNSLISGVKMTFVNCNSTKARQTQNRAGVTS